MDKMQMLAMIQASTGIGIGLMIGYGGMVAGPNDVSVVAGRRCDWKRKEVSERLVSRLAR